MSACKSGPSSAGPDEAALVARKAGHIEGLLAQRPLASGVLAALITNLPDRVWLTDVAYDSGKVRTKGIAPSKSFWRTISRGSCRAPRSTASPWPARS